MECFDCAAVDRQRPAVGICHDCGAAVCAEHARVVPRWLTRAAAINRVVQVEPPGRLVLCPVCEAARDAAAGRVDIAQRRPAARPHRQTARG